MNERVFIDEMAELPELDSEPYPLPSLPPAEIAELEAQTAETVVTVRDEQSLYIANLGNDQLPHFLLTRDGGEVCGSDGEPWPCTTFLHEVAPAAEQASADAAPPQTYTAAEVAMADELGITAAEVRERMRAR